MKIRYILEKNNIKIHHNLYSILKYLFEEEYDFSRLHIKKKKLNIDLTHLGVIVYLLKGKENITMDDMHEACGLLNLKESTKYSIIDNLSQYYDKIDDIYFPKDRIDL